MGQLTNQAAIELIREGFGNMFCLACIGGHLSCFVKSARDMPQMVLIDGCDIGCGKAALEHAEVPLKNYLVVTDMGIEKTMISTWKKRTSKRSKKLLRKNVYRIHLTIFLCPKPVQQDAVAS